MAASKADLHRKGHELFSKGDLEGLKDIIAEDAVWYVTGQNELAGDHRGREQIFSFFYQLMERSGGTFRLEDEAFLEDGDYTVAVSRVRATRGDKTLDLKMCELVRWRDGKVVEEWAMFDDPYSADEFWS